MRPLLHVCAMLLALPQVLLCALVLLLGHMTAGRSLGSLLTRTLDVLYALFSWGGLIAIAAFLALLVAGFTTRGRVVATAVVAAAIVASGAILVIRIGAVEPFLFAPGAVALAICGWQVRPVRKLRPADGAITP